MRRSRELKPKTCSPQRTAGSQWNNLVCRQRHPHDSAHDDFNELHGTTPSDACWSCRDTCGIKSLLVQVVSLKFDSLKFDIDISRRYYCTIGVRKRSFQLFVCVFLLRYRKSLTVDFDGRLGAKSVSQRQGALVVVLGRQRHS